jgi:DNA-binding response OmpR family regulator
MEVASAVQQIIVCDDERDIRDFLHFFLRQHGYEPLLAGDMKGVLNYIKTQKPRLILLDIRMPEQDGFEIAETLRRHGNGIPIIFITAHDNMFCRVYSPTVGAVGYFTKPLDTDALIRRIEQVMNGTAGPSSSSLIPSVRY